MRIRGTGFGLIVSLLSIAGAGCGDDAADAPPGELRPVGPCSDVTRLLARYSGREGELCGPIGVFRELIPVGHGYFIVRNLLSNVLELWGLGPDGTFGGGPRAENVGSHFYRNHLAIGLGQGRGLLYEQETGEHKLLSINLAAIGNQQIEDLVTNGSSNFEPIRTRRDLLALDDSHLLLWEPGNGRFMIRPYDRNNETFDNPTFRGTRADFMLRGHRLIPLGGGRLLEWVAVTGAYRIWEYAFDGRFPDGFGASAVASGTWAASKITRDHEILVIDADRLLLWNRVTGELDVRALDPLAPDPLAGPSLVRETHERLSSLPLGWAPHTTSPIRRLLLILQRGRSFDHHFGRYCTGTGVPACSDQGRACCEAMPETTPGADACHPVDPAIADDHVPNASDPCMTWKMNGREMNQFAVPSPTVPNCGHAQDFACVPPAPPSALTVYHDLADQGALADQHFSFVADWSAYVIYLLFTHASGTDGSETIMSLLSKQLVPWALYMKDPVLPLFDDATHYDARWSFLRWYDELWRDIELEQLGPFTVVSLPDHEMPGNDAAAACALEVRRIVDAIERSPYRDETLVLVAHMTSGGFYDHVHPPDRPAQETDSKGLAYGPRSPLLALGPFAKRGHVSHVQLEASSLTRFVEWNWFGGVTGLLDARDEVVNNIGDLLGPAAGPVPSEEAPAAGP